MTFTIPAFWVGVGATILVEVVLIIVAAGVSAFKAKKKGGSNNDGNK